MRDHPPEPARLKRSLLTALGAALGVAALTAVFMSSGGIDEVLDAVGRVTAGWTVAAFGAILAGYLLLALHMRRLAQGQISLWRAARTDMLLFGLGNVLPGAPAPGAVLAAAELQRGGLSARAARFIIAFTAWFNIRSLLGIGAVAFLVAFARQHPGLKEAGLWWLAAVAVLVLLGLTARMASRPATAERTMRLLARLRINRVAAPLQPADSVPSRPRSQLSCITLAPHSMQRSRARSSIAASPHCCRQRPVHCSSVGAGLLAAAQSMARPVLSSARQPACEFI